MHSDRLPKPQRNLTGDWFKVVLAIVIVTGICLRFVHLNHQVYWHDEAYTSLRISGHTSGEVLQDLFTGKVIGLEDLRRYQQPNPGKTILDTIQSLAIEDPQHPPFYYGLVKLWADAFGASVAVLRTFSALVSLLLFPSAAWLCWELFGLSNHTRSLETESSPIPRSMAVLSTGLFMALLAVSPYHVLYAQEAREYGLWAVLILVSGAALLRADRLMSWRAWALYSLSVILGLYTQPLMLPVAIGHGIYLAILHRQRGLWHRSVRCFLLSLSVALLAFSPWLKIIVQNWGRTGTSWMSVPIPLLALLKTWGLHLERAFLLTFDDFGFDDWQVYVSLPIFLGLLGYGVYYLIRHTPLKIWLFSLLLATTAAFPLMLADLVLGGQRSTSSRYFVPFYLGLHLTIAIFLAAQVSGLAFLKTLGFKLPDPKKKLWQGISVALLMVSLLACVVNTQMDTAWTKVISYNLPKVARILNGYPKPLLVGSSHGINFGTIFALSYLVDPQVKFQIIEPSKTYDPKNILPRIPDRFQDVFVLVNHSEIVRQTLEKQQQKKSELVFTDNDLALWKLTDRPRS